MMNRTIVMICAVAAALSWTPSAAAAPFEEVGGCVYLAECTWVDNNGEVHNCESNGNVAIILGDGNHVNYCHDESNDTSTNIRIQPL